jgi:hypothetical protein
MRFGASAANRRESSRSVPEGKALYPETLTSKGMEAVVDPDVTVTGNLL